MSAPIPPSTQISQISGYITIATLGVSVWEGLITFDDEVAFIWPMPHRAYIKWLYLFAKYFTLAMQTGVLWVQVDYLPYHPISLQHCRVYRTLEMTAIGLLMLCFDTILLLRIFALYGRHTWSCVFALCVVLAENVMTATSMAMIIPTMMYDSACVLIQAPTAMLVYVIGSLTSQTILLWLAYRKRERVVRVRSSIACVTIRDGIVAFVCITVFFLLLFICVLYHSPLTSLTIFWLPMGTSVATCRLILNLQRVTRIEPTQQFTTEIWELDTSADSCLLPDIPAQSRLAW